MHQLLALPRPSVIMGRQELHQMQIIQQIVPDNVLSCVGKGAADIQHSSGQVAMPSAS